MSFATCYYILQSYLEGDILHFYNLYFELYIITIYACILIESWSKTNEKLLPMVIGMLKV